MEFGRWKKKTGALKIRLSKIGDLLSGTLFREESEFEAKTGPNPPTNSKFQNIQLSIISTIAQAPVDGR